MLLGAALFCVAGAALEHLRLVLRGRRSTWSISSSFCVAGTELVASPARFAWQAQHLEHLNT